MSARANTCTLPFENCALGYSCAHTHVFVSVCSDTHVSVCSSTFVSVCVFLCVDVSLLNHCQGLRGWRVKFEIWALPCDMPHPLFCSFPAHPPCSSFPYSPATSLLRRSTIGGLYAADLHTPALHKQTEIGVTCKQPVAALDEVCVCMYGVNQECVSGL